VKLKKVEVNSLEKVPAMKKVRATLVKVKKKKKQVTRVVVVKKTKVERIGMNLRERRKLLIEKRESVKMMIVAVQ
jgi:hypothetical protein